MAVLWSKKIFERYALLFATGNTDRVGGREKNRALRAIYSFYTENNEELRVFAGKGFSIFG
jgi:hypothetical protein